MRDGISWLECRRVLVRYDSRMGIKAAKAADMYGIFIPDLVEADDEIKGEARYILNSLHEVIEWLKNK